MPLQSVDSARRERWFSPAKVLACFAICAIAAKLALLRSAGPCLEDRLHLQDQRLLSLRNSTQGQGTRITPPGATPPSGNRVLIITIATASHKEVGMDLWSAASQKAQQEALRITSRY